MYYSSSWLGKEWQAKHQTLWARLPATHACLKRPVPGCLIYINNWMRHVTVPYFSTANPTILSMTFGWRWVTFTAIDGFSNISDLEIENATAWICHEVWISVCTASGQNHSKPPTPGIWLTKWDTGIATNEKTHHQEVWHLLINSYKSHKSHKQNKQGPHSNKLL